MIPVFPGFKKLELKDKEEIIKYTSAFDPYSDYNFVSLWSYNTKDNIEVSKLNKNLVVKFLDYTSEDQFYSFLGNNETRKTIEILLEHTRSKNLKQQLKLIPEIDLVDKKVNKSFSIKEDKDNFDYILSVEELYEYKGKKYQNKRKLSNRFRRLYPNAQVKELNLSDKSTHKNIRKLFKHWSQKKQDSEHELVAIQRTLKHANKLNLLGIGIFDNKKLIAFVISDIENKEYAETHFVKADTLYVGIYQFLRKEFARNLKKREYKFINIEQDLGILGLRTAKEQWHPVKYLKKYIVTGKT